MLHKQMLTRRLLLMTLFLELSVKEIAASEQTTRCRPVWTWRDIEAVVERIFNQNNYVGLGKALQYVEQ